MRRREIECATLLRPSSTTHATTQREEADYSNHMDYTLTHARPLHDGQILRMHAILNNGYRASVWQSGECTDPNFLDVQLLSVRNERRCDDVFVPWSRLLTSLRLMLKMQLLL